LSILNETAGKGFLLSTLGWMQFQGIKGKAHPPNDIFTGGSRRGGVDKWDS